MAKAVGSERPVGSRRVTSRKEESRGTCRRPAYLTVSRQQPGGDTARPRERSRKPARGEGERRARRSRGGSGEALSVSMRWAKQPGKKRRLVQVRWGKTWRRGLELRGTPGHRTGSREAPGLGRTPRKPRSLGDAARRCVGPRKDPQDTERLAARQAARFAQEKIWRNAVDVERLRRSRWRYLG